MPKLIYVAHAYYNPNPLIRHSRAFIVSQYISQHLKDHDVYYSPVMHGLGILSVFPEEDKQDSYNWAQHNEQMLELCNEVRVICFTGWEDSVGLANELDVCTEKGIPVSWVNFEVDRRGIATFYEA